MRASEEHATHGTSGQAEPENDEPVSADEARRRLNEASETDLAAKAQLNELAARNARLPSDESGERAAEFAAAEATVQRTEAELHRAAEALRSAEEH
jgi:hypothetical protein